MIINWNFIETNSVKFSKYVEENLVGEEKQEAQKFESKFMEIFGIYDGEYEYRVKIDNNKYIDYLLKGKLLIEMKSKGKSLDEAYNQAMEYVYNLSEEDRPVLIMCCDFDKIKLYNFKKNHHYKEFRVKNLKKHIRYFAPLLGIEEDFDENALELNIKATKMMSELHDILLENGYEGHQLEIFLVRLLFCLFADDSGIFEHKLFEKYISNSKEDGSDLSGMINILFSTLNTPENKRMKSIQSNLLKFRYINGNLFSEKLDPVFFNEKTRKIILDCSKFDWSQISPAIFGAMFQGVMDKEKRRDLGAHYTSEENILKVIKPLFLDELYLEFEKSKRTKKELKSFHEKISKLKFLDPACGSGNFLILTYQKLRELEFEILKLLGEDSQLTLFDINSKVHINQFYGIEYESFASEIAKISMLLIKHLMDQRISNSLGFNIVDFPIKENANILNGNALRVDWLEFTGGNVDYIMGNPPFVGARVMNKEQSLDMVEVFGKLKGAKDLDYVSAWFFKGSNYLKNNIGTKIAFVSTNSISQGEQVASLWKPILNENQCKIDFAYRSFKWNNEATGKAQVYCIIVGISNKKRIIKDKQIFLENGGVIKCSNINPYLIAGEDIFVESAKNSLTNQVPIAIGNKIIDDGNYIFSEEEKEEFIKKEPKSEKYFYNFIGAKEFLQGEKRYILMAQYIPIQELRTMKNVLNIIEKVQKFRLESKSEGTRKIAETPMKFHVTNLPESNYLVIPQVTTENRKYIPIGFLSKDNIPSNLVSIIFSEEISLFSILTSSTHMAWVKTVAGRLGNGYRYSGFVVYNNFPFLKFNKEKKEKLIKTGQKILDIRNKYPEWTYADLYDPLLMPADLRKAHHENDKAVWEAYGKKWEFGNDEECLEYLLKLYKNIVDKNKKN